MAPTTIIGLARELDVPPTLLVDIIDRDPATNFYAHMDPDRRVIRTRLGSYGDYTLTQQGRAALVLQIAARRAA